MRRKKGLLAVVAALAVSSVMAAMAFSTALVPNTVNTAIVNTNQALVSVKENPKFTDFASIKADGKMYLDFTKGYNNSDTGFQPGSNYQFNDLLYIKNNITKPIKVGLRFDSVYKGATSGFPQGLHVIKATKNGKEIAVEGKGVVSGYSTALVHVNGGTFNAGYYEDIYVTLQPGDEIGLNWSFVNSAALASEKGSTLQIMAEAIR